MNLILMENALTMGETYIFQLNVTQWDDTGDMIGFGESIPIEVYVLKAPTIVSDSFQIFDCKNVSFGVITDLLETKHEIRLLAEGDYLPLLYQFGYHDKYLHPSLIPDAMISDVYLSVGESEIFVDVYDSKSAKVNARISCDVRLDSYSECPDFEDDIILPYLAENIVLNEDEIGLFVLKQSMVYLEYLQYGLSHDYLDITSCVSTQLDVILFVLSEYFSSAELCSTSYAVLLSQIMTLWIDIANDGAVTEKFINNAELQVILYAVLDPCEYITNSIGFSNIESLTISSTSIITNVPIIYNNNHDITPYLSPIIINSHYIHLLYTLSSRIVSVTNIMTDYQNAMDLHNLLSASMYISELAKLSTTIPGENTQTTLPSFDIYSVRVSHSDVDISIENTGISVHIPKDVTSGGNTNTYAANADIDDSLSNYVDVVVFRIDTSETELDGFDPTTLTDKSGPHGNSQTSAAAAAAFVADDECSNYENVLSENSVGVTILNNNTNPHNLSSNINITIPINHTINTDDRNENVSIACVWLNETSNTWETEGCDTIYIESIDQYACSCSHLTTFSMVRSLRKRDNSKKVVVTMRICQLQIYFPNFMIF